MDASSSSQNVSNRRKKQKMDDKSSLDSSNKSEIISSVANYIIAECVHNFPIKKSDIISKALNGNSKIFSEIFQTVLTEIKESHGINLVEIPNSKPIAYIGTSEYAAGPLAKYPEKDQKDFALLFIILSYILMKGSYVKEEVLYQFLDRFNIRMDETNSYFGSNLKKKINDTFIRQLYLKKEKLELEASNEQQIIFSWGFRSTIEFPKKEVFKKVCLLMERPEICFANRYEEIFGDNEKDEDEEMSD